ncbi:MAG: acyltransferase family protein, partial [Oscillospiraceae bacterium]
MNERKHYIDNIRWVTVVLVIIYHAVYMYNSVGVITNISVKGIPQLDALLYFLYPWFMILLFVVAGMSARYSLEKRSGKEFMSQRAKTILVPSVVGIFAYGWINGFITNQYVDMFGGQGDLIPGFIKGMIYCISGIGPLW